KKCVNLVEVLVDIDRRLLDTQRAKPSERSLNAVPLLGPPGFSHGPPRPWRLTFELTGTRRPAKPAVAFPVQRRVRPHSRASRRPRRGGGDSSSACGAWARVAPPRRAENRGGGGGRGGGVWPARFGRGGVGPP